MSKKLGKIFFVFAFLCSATIFQAEHIHITFPTKNHQVSRLPFNSATIPLPWIPPPQEDEEIELKLSRAVDDDAALEEKPWKRKKKYGKNHSNSSLS